MFVTLEKQSGRLTKGKIPVPLLLSESWKRLKRGARDCKRNVLPRVREETTRISRSREKRLQEKRVAESTRKDHENQQEREKRLQEKRVAESTRRDHENQQEREERLEDVRVAVSTRRENETQQEREKRWKTCVWL